MQAVVRISYSLILIAALGLFVAHVNFVFEVNAVKEYTTDCNLELSSVGTGRENRHCCEYEYDTETEEEVLTGCYIESCRITSTGKDLGCVILDRPVGEQGALPTTPTITPDPGLFQRTPDQGKLLLTPPESESQDTSTTGDTVLGTDSPQQDQSVQSSQRSPTGYCVPEGPPEDPRCGLPCDPGLPSDTECVPEDIVTGDPIVPPTIPPLPEEQEQEPEPQMVGPETVLEETVPLEDQAEDRDDAQGDQEVATKVEPQVVRPESAIEETIPLEDQAEDEDEAREK